MSTVSTDVVVAGGGVAGLAVANAFARRGLRSVVLEKRRAPGEIDRGDVIHDSVLPILLRWDLQDRLAAYGPVQTRIFKVLNEQGETIFQVDLQEALGRSARLTLVTHPDLERMLEDAAVATGLVEVRRETTCLDLILEGGRVAGVRTSEGDVTGPLTVVANGAQSALRDRYFPRGTFHEYACSFFNARVKLIPAFADAGFYILGPTGVMVVAPLPKGEMRIGLQFRRTSDAQDGVSSRNFRSIVTDRLGKFPVHELEFLDGHVYRLSRSLAHTLWIPGAAIVGDAAHTVHPAGGQGMNLAFQDAELLAASVSEAAGRASALDRACQRYSTTRRRQVKRVLRLTHILGLLGSLERLPLIRAREAAIRMCNRSTTLKRLFVQRIIGVS